MNRRKDGALERLRRLAWVSDRVLQGLVIACGQQLPGPGRPCRYALDVQVLVLLVKLRLDLPYRALEVISGIDTVTASRMVKRMLERLSEWTWRRRPEPTGFYRVDTTTVRVRVRQDNYYSGYKHHRGMKTQVLADEGMLIHHLSAAWPARVHDKVIWDRTLEQLYPLLRRPVLADKAYAGAHLEGYGLIRPIKHNEQGYLAAPEQAKAFNRELSRRRVRIEHVMASLEAVPDPGRAVQPGVEVVSGGDEGSGLSPQSGAGVCLKNDIPGGRPGNRVRRRFLPRCMSVFFVLNYETTLLYCKK